MSYTSWNDYFRSCHDNSKPEKQKTRTYDDFHNAYRKMYGEWFDYHHLELIEKYGVEKADQIIKENVDKLNEERKKRMQEEQTRYDWKEVPDNYAIPF